jgi:NAD(P)-dependent dehydrogenase (short-subunit alcohol dehydrogenase family)
MFTETHTIPTSVCRPGGAVISIREDSKLVLLPAPPPTLSLDPEATYVLAGGLGGIGRSIAETMVSAGARNIAFVSRSGAKADEAKKLLSSLQLRGCTAKAYSCDASSSAAVEAYVKAATERGERIKGVVQCAMVLRDSIFDNMTFEQWTESTRPKIQGSWNLHTHFPKDMDFFIMLSSMAGVIGNPGKHHLVCPFIMRTLTDKYSQAKQTTPLLAPTKTHSPSTVAVKVSAPQRSIWESSRTLATSPRIPNSSSASTT